MTGVQTCALPIYNLQETKPSLKNALIDTHRARPNAASGASAASATAPTGVVPTVASVVVPGTGLFDRSSTLPGTQELLRQEQAKIASSWYAKSDLEADLFQQHYISRFDAAGDEYGTTRAHFAAFAAGRPLQPTVSAVSGHVIATPFNAQEPKHLIELIVGYEERVAALFGVPRSFFAQFSAGKSANSPDGREMWHNSQRALKQMVSMYLEMLMDHIFVESHQYQLMARGNAEELALVSWWLLL